MRDLGRPVPDAVPGRVVEEAVAGRTSGQLGAQGAAVREDQLAQELEVVLARLVAAKPEWPKLRKRPSLT